SAHADLGVEAPEALLRGHRFRQTLRRVVLVEERLALEVRLLDVVAVDDGQRPDAGSRHGLGEGGAEGPDAGHHDARRTDPLLARRPDAVEELLARVAVARRRRARPALGAAHDSRSSAAMSAAERIASTGASSPVQVSNWATAWASSISRPVMTVAPAAWASRRKRVSSGS